MNKDFVGHHIIAKWLYCPECGADKFDKAFGCWCCGAAIVIFDKCHLCFKTVNPLLWREHMAEVHHAVNNPETLNLNPSS